MNNQPANEAIEIDLLHIVKILWQKFWLILLCMIALGATAFSYAHFFIAPQYEAQAMMYVNNSSISLGATSVSLNDITTARNLVDVYSIILKSRTTLEKVIEEADLDYSYNTLANMVTTESVNSTEVFRITVTSTDPAEAQLIANTIVEILPDSIADIVDGTSVRVVDRAVIPSHRSSPSYTKYAIVGALIGFILSAGVLIIIDLMDTTVRDEEYLNQRYSIPVLAVIPDAYSNEKSSYSYYKHSEDTAEKED